MKTLIAAAAIAALASCTTYKAGVVINSPSAPVIAGSAAAQASHSQHEYVTGHPVGPAEYVTDAAIADGPSTGQSLTIDGDVNLQKEYDITADDADTIEPKVRTSPAILPLP